VLTKCCRRFINADNTEEPNKHKESAAFSIDFEGDGKETAGTVVQCTFLLKFMGSGTGNMWG